MATLDETKVREQLKQYAEERKMYEQTPEGQKELQEANAAHDRKVLGALVQAARDGGFEPEKPTKRLGDNPDLQAPSEDAIQMETADDMPETLEKQAETDRMLRLIYAYYALSNDDPNSEHKSDIMYYPPADQQDQIRQIYFKNFFQEMAEQHADGKYIQVDTYNQIADATVESRAELIQAHPELAEIDKLSMDVARHDINVQSAFMAKNTSLDACTFYDKDGNELNIAWDYDNQADYDAKTRALIDAMDHGDVMVKLPDGSDMKVPVVEDEYLKNLDQYDEKMADVMQYRARVEDRVQEKIADTNYQRDNTPEYLQDKNYQRDFWADTEKNSAEVTKGQHDMADAYQSGGYRELLSRNGISLENNETELDQQHDTEQTAMIPDAEEKTENQKQIDDVMKKGEALEQKAREQQQEYNSERTMQY